MLLTVTLNASLDKTYSVPGFAVGRDVAAAHVECSPGGKGLNVASFARALGAEVLATGILGGHTGRHVRDLIAARGIANDFVWIEGESRSCHIIYDPDANTLSQIREPGPPVPPGTRRAVVEKFRELAAHARVVVMSGSLPPGLGSDTYKELVAIARRLGVPAILDASDEPLALGLEAGPSLIKPNLDELRELARRLGLTGDGPAGDEPAVDAPAVDGQSVRRWAAGVAWEVRRRFGTQVVASLGPLGAVVAEEGGVYAMVPPSIQAVNTISCGDALVAGIAVGWTRGWSLHDAVRLGVAAATAKARRFSTGSVTAEEAAELLPRVATAPLSLG
ncbi:MAG: hypothetical protein BAA04_11520 [Firmicutes bacterium ZCTH02-B6]|nr:MAG: hypothetical protein BAA04_11520 [Firmicutes bacterium ZCTH02-B6]